MMNQTVLSELDTRQPTMLRENTSITKATKMISQGPGSGLTGVRA
jgi:hypothetical protein